MKEKACGYSKKLEGAKEELEVTMVRLKTLEGRKEDIINRLNRASENQETLENEKIELQNTKLFLGMKNVKRVSNIFPMKNRFR